MVIIEIFFIAISLSMDSFAVSVSNGIRSNNIRLKDSIKIASAFGIFQGLMPIAGWILGIELKNIISSVDHWIAFVLLGLIGLKMINSALKKEAIAFPKRNDQTIGMV